MVETHGHERAPWDRRDGESTKAYASFRQFRDLGPNRSLSRMPADERRSSTRWSALWDWQARATAWDDQQAMIEDAERLDALRNMHRTHQIAARAALSIALTALRELDPATMTAAEIARLIELGARLERLTLTQSVQELQGLGAVGSDDPWDRIAHELSAS